MHKTSSLILLFAMTGCGKSAVDSSLNSSTVTSPSFAKGDKVQCFDDVSGETATIKFLGTDSLAAYVRFASRSESRFYASAQVKVTYSNPETTLAMKAADGTPETLILSDSIKSGAGVGIYADGGDSRALDCVLKDRSASDASDEYVQIAYLENDAVQKLVASPDQMTGQVPAAVLAVAKDGRMAQSFATLRAKVRAEGDTPEMKRVLEETIHVVAYRQGKQVTVYVEGDADDRGDSTWSFTVEYDTAAKKILSWSAVEYTDHP